MKREILVRMVRYILHRSIELAKHSPRTDFTILIMCTAMSWQQPTLTTPLNGKQDFTLAQADLDAISTLLSVIKQASSSELQDAAQQLVTELEHEENEIQKQEEHLKTLDDAIPRSFYHRQFINKQRIEHFKQFLAAHNSWEQYVYDTGYAVRHLLNNIIDYFSGTKTPKTVETIVEGTQNYFRIEDEEILDDIAGLTHLSALLKLNKLPPFLAVWQDRTALEELKLRAQRMQQDRPRIQMKILEMAGNFGLMGITFAAGSEAMTEAEKPFYDSMKKLDDQQQSISNDFKSFMTKNKQDEDAALAKINTASEAQKKQLEAEYSATQALFGNEITYINKSVASFKNPLSFLTSKFKSALELDIAFEGAAMLTPDNDSIWYDPFQGGAWEFDGMTKSFWQNGLEPMPTSFSWDTESGVDPARYSIFTEYINPEPKTGDIIEVTLNLINCTWPFFAGVMFNKARWVSGDPEAETQYRLLGLYGTQADMTKPETRQIMLCFAQQIILNPDPTKSATVVSPLEQIIKGAPGTVLYNFTQQDATKNDTSQLNRNPQTYTFKISTVATAVNYTFQKKSTDAQAVTVKEGQLTNLILSTVGQNGKPVKYSLARYHGIGFIATGCQAQYAITKPSALTYTDNQLATFATKRANYIADLIQKQNAGAK